MTLNPEHLRTFAVVSETGSLTRAGLLLDLGQSAISTQLKHLQEQMGEPLYRRAGHGVTLTPAGEALLPCAREIARQVQLAQQVMDHRQQAMPVPVRLGLCLTLGEVLPPMILAACAARCPDVLVDVVVAPTHDLARAVEARDLTLAFAGGTGAPSQTLQVRHVATDRLVWVPPQDHGGMEATLREAVGVPWLWATPQSTVRSVVESAARQLGLELPAGRTLGSYEAVRRGVRGGLGGAILPHHHLQRSPQEGGLVGVTLTDVDLRLPYQAFSAALPLPPSALRVKQIALDVLDETLGAR